MTTPVRILAFAGSMRKESLNRKLLKIAVAGARAAGAEVTEIDLREFDIPLYDGDLEATSGFPAGVQRLKKLFMEHQGLLLASPEHNSAPSALMKNTIDWVSRAAPGEGSLACFQGKVACIVGASPNVHGGVRGAAILKNILGNIGVIVIPEQVLIGKAPEAFDAQGNLKDAAAAERTTRAAARLAAVASKLKG